MDCAKITEYIGNLKKNGRVVSNVYSQTPIERAEEFAADSHAVVFAYNDNGIDRLYFYAHHIEAMSALLSKLKRETYVMEFMTGNGTEDTAEFERMGFRRIADMLRMSVRDCSASISGSSAAVYYNESIGEFPKEEAVDELNDLLRNTFDARISHLPDKKELTASVRNREITIHRSEDGAIDAMLQVVLLPKRFYINQIINLGDKSIIHAMLLNRLREFCAGGGRYAFAWVEKNNAASIKFHGKYGFSHDGTSAHVYVLERNPKR